MNDKTLELLWIAAFRYHLGRRTYAVSEFCEALIQNWKDVPEFAKVLIKRELEREFHADDRMRANGYQNTKESEVILPLGDNCDRASWELVRSLWK